MENLLNFPQTTFVDKLIPKAKFVKASDTPTAVRNLLAEEAEQIRLLYILREDTINVIPGSEVREIDMFYIRMKENHYSINPFCALDKLIPRHTFYIIQYGESIDILMQHKQRTVNQGSASWKVITSELRRQVKLDELNLRIEGLDLDRVYFNILSQISGYHIDNTEALLAIKILENETAKKRRQVESLQKQVRKEKQFNMQIELNSQARAVKKEIIELTTQLQELKNNKI